MEAWVELATLPNLISNSVRCGPLLELNFQGEGGIKCSVDLVHSRMKAEVDGLSKSK